MKKLMLTFMILILSIFSVACSPMMFVGGNCFGNLNNNNDNKETTIYDEETTYAEETTTEEETVSGIAGTYVCEDTVNYSEGYLPYLELYSDGAFYLGVNLGEGMGSIRGTYSEVGDYLDLYVEGRDFSEFLGDDYTIITFLIIDENTLELYSDDIGITYNGELFVRN